MQQQNNKTNSIRNSIFIGSLAVYLGAIHFSPGIASVASILLLVNAAWHFNENIQIKSLSIAQTLFISVFFVSIGISLLHGCALNQLLPKLLVRLPVVFLPSLMSFVKHRNIILSKHWYLFALPIFWLAIASVCNYAVHYNFLSQMVLESKPLPIYSKVYHIEFSVIISLVLLILLSWKLEGHEMKMGGINFFFYLIFGGLFIALHVLSARTGLLGFWSGVMFMAWNYRRRLSLKYILVVAAVMVAIVFVPSVKNRIVNTLEDLSAVTHKEDLNDKSFGQRWEAWGAIIHAGKKTPLFGVGQCNIENTMQKSFDELKSDLDAENRISPHNQYLQWFIELGLVGMVLWIVAVAFTIYTARKWQISIFVFAIALAIGLSITFESLFERQAGILAIIVSLCFISSNKLITNPKTDA
jgi:O-antigen ligase